MVGGDGKKILLKGFPIAPVSLYLSEQPGKRETQ